tara:strand:- start:30 stop:1805 length:1776 start_codon:yes stop_codon:yes gene_type:complete
MDVNTILNAASQFLLTPPGIKLLEKLDIDNIDKVTEAIKLASESNIIDKNDAVKPEKINLTEEEKKRLKEIRRESRNELISEEYDRLKAEGKERAGQEIGNYEPYIQKFTVKGKVYDEFSKDPIYGIKVYPQLCVFPVSTDPTIYGTDLDDDFGSMSNVVRQNRITKEALLDKEGNVLFQGVGDADQLDPLNSYPEINFDDNKLGQFYVKTDVKGEFTITIGLPVLDAQPTRTLTPPKTPPFLAYVDGDDRPQTITDVTEDLNGEFKGSQYAPSIQAIVTQNGEIPTELNIHALYNINKAAEIAKDKAVEEVNQFVITEIDPYFDIPATFLNNLRKSVLKPATVVQTKLLPLAFELMIFFGIAKEEQANQLQSQCPSNERLKDIIRKRNSIVKQINNIFIIIVANTALAFLFEYLSRYLKGITKIIEGLNFPVAVGGVGIPFSVISKLEGIKDALDKLGEVNKELKKQLIIALIFLIISLIIILRYLKTIDKLIEGCESTENLVAINAELLALSEQATEQGEPQVKIVNGFDMSVEVVDKAQVGELPRRQAIAKNSKGIIVLRGEPSFSAEDQILIDELSFYIQINNLKAD